MSLHSCLHQLNHAPFPLEALESSIPERFHLQVDRHAECVAVRERRRSITYAELDDWSNGIAHELIEALGDGPEPVPLVQYQGAGSIAATLGVLKAGKFYVPLDPLEPAARLRRSVEDVGARLLAIDEESRDSVEDLGLPVLVVDGLSAPQPPAHPVPPSAVAYVYFTSGSTGRPKGVYDSHRNVLHNVLRYTNALEIAAEDRLTLLQKPSFSGAVSSLFCALLNGATSCPFRFDGGTVADAARWLVDEEMTVYHSVPSIFRTVAATGSAFPHVRAVRLEGDRAAAFDVELFRRHFPPHCVLANGLGTTETGLVRQLIVRHGDAVADGVLPVGYAVRDMDVVILDGEGAELLPGASGEVAVRSDYLALGYWDEPGLTDESFLPGGDGDTRRLYRTGDMGRLRNDGCLEYLGRLDAELKVHGSRVDIGEVEAELVRLPGIADAAVTTAEGRRREGRLLAYLVTENGSEVDVVSVRRALAERLPAHAIPSGFATLESLPVGANGKIDRDRLPEISPASGASTHDEDELVRAIAAIWSDVLEVPVGPDDDYFQLGGDSLAAAEIVAAVERATRVSLSIGSLVTAPTPRALSREIGRPRDTDPLDGSRLVPLSTSLEGPRLFLVHGISGQSLIYRDLAPALEPALSAWGVESEQHADVSQVEEVAARHVGALRSLQPDGPYLLGGYCSGAVVAFDMARQLDSDGGEVALLVLLGFSPLDFPTLVSEAGLRRWRSRHSRARHYARRARQLPPRELATRVLHRSRAFVNRRSNDYRPGLAGAIARYVPQPAHAPVLAVLEGDTALRYTDDPPRDWRNLSATGRLEIHVVPGPDHVVLYDRPEQAARLIREAGAAALDAQTLP